MDCVKNRAVSSAAAALLLIWPWLWLLCAPRFPLAEPAEVAALLNFSSGIHSDPLGLLSRTWNSSAVESDGCPARSWHGVTCSGGHVTALVLDNLLLAGEVSLKPLTQLRMLQNISISNNSLSGGLEPSVTTLTELQSLNLGHNRFRGRIPRGLENLHKLSALDLHANHLTGYVDKGLLNLDAVEYIDLSSNMLSGPLPGLDSPNTRLAQTLRYINVSNNRLSGSILSKVPVPFEKLKVLDLSSNQFTGKLPSLDYLYALQIVRLGANQFYGPLPNAPFIENAYVLQELDLSQNNLSGNVPMVSSTTLKVINLSSNKLSGQLPIKFGVSADVNLSRNNLSGNLTSMKTWGNCIKKLDLSDNSFSGSFPNDTSTFLRLTYLNLSRNALNGLLPDVLATYPSINVIDLSFNQFSGHVLPSLFQLSSLAHLNLSNNNFTGAISVPDAQSVRPAEALGLISIVKSRLESLDLSDNLLNGTIPSQIGDFVTVKTLNLARNQLSGIIPKEMGKLHALVFLDLSGNQLSGKLPDNFPDSLKSLNVSYNNLSGVVPRNLRRFPESSFHPGNVGLVYPHTPSESKEPARKPAGVFGRRHRGIKSSIKAVIIGVCTAVTVLLLSIALILYLRRNSKFKQFGRGTSREITEVRSDFQQNLPTSYFNIRKSTEPSRPLSFSEEQLLSPEKRSLSLLSLHPTDPSQSDVIAARQKEIESSDRSPSKNKRRLLPASHSFLSSPQSEAIPISERKVQSPDRLAGDLFFLDTTLTFTAEELSRAPAEVLGRSSYGTSYKATLDNGHILTVKWLREGLAKPKSEFSKEAKKFRKAKHPNLVPMRGYYWGPREHEKLIFSDYIITENLAQRLHERLNLGIPPLAWSHRVKIAVDIARGLLYLHCDMSLPHGNLKATNILVDGPELAAKLADYCLHLLTTSAGTAEHIFNAGALGYRSPELAESKKPKPSFKGDIYAFGVILIEIITGRSAGDIVCESSGAVDLTDWVKRLATEGHGMDCFDLSLMPYDTQECPKGVDDMLSVALQCIQPVQERPTIKTVYGDLTSIVI